MKLKCIKSIRYLTEGKYYKVSPSEKFLDQYWVWQADLGEGGWYPKEVFQSIQDNRNDKINEIVK